MGDDSVFKMSFASDAYFYKGLDLRVPACRYRRSPHTAYHRYFYKGLEGFIGPPHPLLGEAIKREHCEAQDSREPFKT